MEQQRVLSQLASQADSSYFVAIVSNRLSGVEEDALFILRRAITAHNAQPAPAPRRAEPAPRRRAAPRAAQRRAQTASLSRSCCSDPRY
jgi:hypothetical protein